MKRLWIGIILLSVMLAGGIGMLLFSHRFYDGFSGTLERAADAALSEDWTTAKAQLEKATEHWQHHHRFWASFTNHEPVEQIKLLLARLELYQNARLAVDFADACESLSHFCEAIDEFHSLNWWALL